MKRRKLICRLLLSFLVLFLLINLVAFFHAWKFTHFDADVTSKTAEANTLSAWEKVKIVFTGIDLPRPRNNQQPVRPFQQITLNSNRNISCWLIPRDSARGTVVVFHGYGGSKSSMLDKADVFYSLGFNVFMVDFMGSGESEGNQTTIGFLEAEQVKSAVEYCRTQGEKNVVLFGTSLGAAAIMRAISELNVKAEKIIIECPFGTMLQTVKNRFANIGFPSFPLAHLLTFWGGVQNGFNAFQHNPEEYAVNIETPTLIFYGQKDIKVTSDEIQRIHENLGGWKKLVNFPEAGHENFLNKYQEGWAHEVRYFLAQTTTQWRLGESSLTII